MGWGGEVGEAFFFDDAFGAPGGPGCFGCCMTAGPRNGHWEDEGLLELQMTGWSHVGAGGEGQRVGMVGMERRRVGAARRAEAGASASRQSLASEDGRSRKSVQSLLAQRSRSGIDRRHLGRTASNRPSPSKTADVFRSRLTISWPNLQSLVLPPCIKLSALKLCFGCCFLHANPKSRPETLHLNRQLRHPYPSQTLPPLTVGGVLIHPSAVLSSETCVAMRCSL